jgi:hypothetical protein
LRGYNDAYSALQALKSNYAGGGLKEISVEEDTSGAEKVYVGRIRASGETLEQPDDEEPQNTISFEVSGSQTKMTHSLTTRGT